MSSVVWVAVACSVVLFGISFFACIYYLIKYRRNQEASKEGELQVGTKVYCSNSSTFDRRVSGFYRGKTTEGRYLISFENGESGNFSYAFPAKESNNTESGKTSTPGKSEITLAKIDSINMPNDIEMSTAPGLSYSTKSMSSIDVREEISRGGEFKSMKKRIESNGSSRRGRTPSARRSSQVLSSQNSTPARSYSKKKSTSKGRLKRSRSRSSPRTRDKSIRKSEGRRYTTASLKSHNMTKSEKNAKMKEALIDLCDIIDEHFEFIFIHEADDPFWHKFPNKLKRTFNQFSEEKSAMKIDRLLLARTLDNNLKEIIDLYNQIENHLLRSFDENFEEMFIAADGDKSQTISLEEFQSLFEDVPVRRFLHMDKSGDRKLDRIELRWHFRLEDGTYDIMKVIQLKESIVEKLKTIADSPEAEKDSDMQSPEEHETSSFNEAAAPVVPSFVDPPTELVEPSFVDPPTELVEPSFMEPPTELMEPPTEQSIEIKENVELDRAMSILKDMQTTIDMMANQVVPPEDSKEIKTEPEDPIKHAEENDTAAPGPYNEESELIGDVAPLTKLMTVESTTTKSHADVLSDDIEIRGPSRSVNDSGLSDAIPVAKADSNEEKWTNSSKFVSMDGNVVLELHE